MPLSPRRPRQRQRWSVALDGHEAVGERRRVGEEDERREQARLAEGDLLARRPARRDVLVDVCALLDADRLLVAAAGGVPLHEPLGRAAPAVERAADVDRARRLALALGHVAERDVDVLGLRARVAGVAVGGLDDRHAEDGVADVAAEVGVVEVEQGRRRAGRPVHVEHLVVGDEQAEVERKERARRREGGVAGQVELVQREVDEARLGRAAQRLGAAVAGEADRELRRVEARDAGRGEMRAAGWTETPAWPPASVVPKPSVASAWSSEM